MAVTEKLYLSDTKQTPHTSLKKSRSFRLSVASLLHKFSTSLSTNINEQNLNRSNSTLSLRKFSTTEANKKIKRDSSFTFTTLKIDRDKKNDNTNVVSLGIIEEIYENKVIIDIRVKSEDAAFTSTIFKSTTISPPLINECKKSKNNITDIDDKIRSLEMLQQDLNKTTVTTPELNESIDNHSIHQKAVSIPVKLTRNPAKNAQLTILTNFDQHNDVDLTTCYNWTNRELGGYCKTQSSTPIKNINSAVTLIELVPFDNNENSSSIDFYCNSPISSDDEDELATPFSCASEHWPSGVSKSVTIRSTNRTFTSEYKPSKSTELFKYDETSSDIYQSQKCIKSIYVDRIQRSATAMPISFSGSTTSMPSSSMFKKISEFQKRESKAISMWYNAVQKLMQQHTFRKSKKSQKCTEKDKTIAWFIINELYSTEKSFHQLLLYIRSNFMEPLYIASQSKNPNVKYDDVHSLFYCLPDLILMAEKLLYNLEEFIKDPNNFSICPGQAIGRIFKDLEQDFVVFVKYAVHYQCNIKSIRRASHNGLILKIDEESKKSEKNNRLGLDDYLIAPFQRVPRYGLLIRDLMKHTDSPINYVEGNGVMNDLIYAQSIVDGLATAMNQVQQKISKSRFSTSFYSSSISHSSSNLVAHHPSPL